MEIVLILVVVFVGGIVFWLNRTTSPDGRDLAEELVKLGLALDWEKHSGGRYRGFETADARKKLWRCAAKHKGELPQHMLSQK